MKKILIVSHNALSLHANNGKTLNSLFSSWDQEDVAQIYFQDEVPESDRFFKFFRIRDLDVLRSYFTLDQRSVGGQVAPLLRVVDHYENSGFLKKHLVGMLRKINGFKLLLRDFIYSRRGWDSEGLRDWIRAFSPDSVFFLGGNSVFSFKIALALAAEFNIPLDIYLTDDYVINARPKNFLARYLLKKLTSVYIDAFRVARHTFVIGESMASKFSERFSRLFYPVMNSVFFQPDLPNSGRYIAGPKTLQIVYAGGLHLGRDESIIRFGEFLNNIRIQGGVDVEFIVYSGSSPSVGLLKSFSSCGIDFRGMVGHQELLHHLQSSHFVLHVESFDRDYVALTSMSVSTKIPEYLSSGACVLAYGPSELASIKIISENNIGCVFSNQFFDENDFRKFVDFIKNLEFVCCCSMRGFNYGKNNFDLSLVRRKFVALLN